MGQFTLMGFQAHATCGIESRLASLCQAVIKATQTGHETLLTADVQTRFAALGNELFQQVLIETAPLGKALAAQKGGELFYIPAIGIDGVIRKGALAAELRQIGCLQLIQTIRHQALWRCCCAASMGTSTRASTSPTKLMKSVSMEVRKCSALLEPMASSPSGRSPCSGTTAQDFTCSPSWPKRKVSSSRRS